MGGLAPPEPGFVAGRSRPTGATGSLAPGRHVVGLPRGSRAAFVRQKELLMNTSIRSFAVVNLFTAVSLAVLAFPSDAAGPCKELLPVRVKVVEQADQGVDALRRYIVVTQGIHQLNMLDVAA